MPLPSATEAKSITALPTTTTTPESTSGSRPRRGRKTAALSDRISHLVARFESLTPPPATVPARPLLSTTSPFADDGADELEPAVRGGQAERGPAVAAGRRDESGLDGSGSKSDPAALNDSDGGYAEPREGDGVDAPAATRSASPAIRNSDRLETKTCRSDSLPAYRDAVYEEDSKPLPFSQYTSPCEAEEAEKGDLGYSDPFADVFAVEGDGFADPLLLADSDLCPPTRHSPPLLQTPSPPRTNSVPLYRVFARKAEPLVLAGLDEVIDALGGAAPFTPMPAVRTGDEIWMGGKRELGNTERSDAFELTASGGKESVVTRSAEWQGWERWVRDGPQPSRWSRFVNAVLPFSRRRRHSGSTDPSLDEAAREARLTTAQYKRSLILPPFHLLPPRVTVTDLKANRRRPAPLVTFQTVLKIVGNGILGAAGSSKGISLTTPRVCEI